MNGRSLALSCPVRGVVEGDALAPAPSDDAARSRPASSAEKEPWTQPHRPPMTGWPGHSLTLSRLEDRRERQRRFLGVALEKEKRKAKYS